MSVRRDLAAHLAAALGESVTVVPTAHRADLTPPWVSVDNGDADLADGIWAANLEAVCAVALGADAETASDALEDLVEAVLDAAATFADVAPYALGVPQTQTTDRYPLLTQTLTVRHLFRICPPEE